ncbi:hypothetical protein CHELA1G11_14056 [Hyphomicrobiales bacterium]|nr:hypothetical protein CHELA1G2_10258 [Hyphomicrobiales bacterium]CAH1675913.1 hypothetical protein CHELA1G11_14056 [Hyphomicrobiales bacterium]
MRRRNEDAARLRFLRCDGLAGQLAGSGGRGGHIRRANRGHPSRWEPSLSPDDNLRSFLGEGRSFLAAHALGCVPAEENGLRSICCIG